MKTYKINHVTLPDAEHAHKELARAIIIQACNDYLETHVTNDTMHTRKAKGVRSAPQTP